MNKLPSNPLPRGPLLILAISWLILFGTFVLPPIPLDSFLAVAVVRIADSGSRWGFPIVATAVVLLLITRAGLSRKQRMREVLSLVGIFGVLFGAGTWFNEFLLKPALGVARPYAVQLDDEGTLGTSLEAFYDGSAYTERSEYLKEVLENPYFTGEKLAVPVRVHWIEQSGHSLPSGHTLGAFVLLTFTLIATKVMTSNGRYRLACLLVPWAVAVAYSRVLLRVHWPNDVLVSGMAGILLGIGLYSLIRRLLWSRRPPAGESAEPELTVA